jgi:hypothetical protein
MRHSNAASTTDIEGHREYVIRVVLGQTKEKKHAIAYASNNMTGTRINYATTEKELCVVFDIDKFNLDLT